MSVGAAIVAAVGLVVQVDANEKNRSAQKESQRTQSASQINQDRAAMRQQAREERIRRAQILQASDALGTGGSSTQFASTASLQQQTAASTANVMGQQQTSNKLGDLNQKMLNAQAQGQFGASMQKIGMQTFEARGGFDNIFG